MLPYCKINGGDKVYASDIALWMSYVNADKWMTAVRKFPSVQNRAGFRWCRLLIQKLSSNQIEEQDWMRGDWKLKIAPNGKIDAIVWKCKPNEIPKITPAPFQLTFNPNP